jgi:hypothetical protein
VHKVWWLVPFFRVVTVVHLYRVLKARSPLGRNFMVVLTFPYTHGREMMEHDDVTAYMC